jgi:hypothetical protein
MYPPRRHLKPSLLAFTLWITLSFMSDGAAANDDALNLDRSAREWTTQEKSQTLVLSKGTTLTLGPNTRVLRLPMIPVALGGQNYAKSAYSVEIREGRLDVYIDPNVRPLYGLVVRAPRTVGAIVKEGKATIAVTPREVTIAARSGKDVMSAISEQWRPLRVGKAFTVSDKNPQGAQRPLLPAPTLQIDNPVSIALGATITPQRLSWTKVSGSESYLLRLYHDLGNASVLIREQQLNETSQLLGNLKAGRYHAIVSSIDETNLEAGQSAKVEFRIVEAIVPKGALVVGNTIQLPALERLQFLHAEGLEMSYGNSSTDFVSAPPSVRLRDGNPVLVRLRERGKSQETRLQLAPMDLVLTAELAPVRAVWPGAPITITVHARHRDGSPAPTENSVFPRVTVNSQPVHVEWQETLGELSCQVDKPPTPGPWVVRVLLRDARGKDVAHDFLEVATRPTP